MDDPQLRAPLTRGELIDRYFMEYRNHLLALAAYLDRLDRAAEAHPDADTEADFRLSALREALEVLDDDQDGRTKRIQMILSDRNVELLDERDTQSAQGAPKAASPAAE